MGKYCIILKCIDSSLIDLESDFKARENELFYIDEGIVKNKSRDS